MKIFRGLPTAPHRAPCVLTIGNFDGVHRGHQALLAQLRATADRLKLPLCVLTFEPHPREFFNPATAPHRITNLRDKLNRLRACGVDRVIVQRFNADFAHLTAQRFIDEVVVETLQTRALIVGDDFRFGAQRQGDFAWLQTAGKQHGFRVETVATIFNEHAESITRVSSSAVRAALQAGDIATARALLGHAYTISGHVLYGRQLGRQLGYPTLNFRVAHRPAVQGIFVVQVHDIDAQPVPGVASIGVRPAVETAGRMLLEVYLLDTSQTLYGRLLRVEFLHKLRDEAHYDSLDKLTQQIAADVTAARAWF